MNAGSDKMKNWDYSKIWYHGSPHSFKAIRKGSTITQDRDLARVFSYKPSIVAHGDNGELLHSGETPGFLYSISEEIGPDDVYPHPHSSMAEGKEWLTKRELQVTRICPTRIVEKERITEKETTEFKRILASQKKGKSGNDGIE